MNASKSSPEMLLELWERYESTYLKQMGRKASKREICNHLNMDEHCLSKWMNTGGHKNRRIPIEHIGKISEALMMNNKETSQLMKTRIMEIASNDPSIKIAISWVIKQSKESLTKKYALDQDERMVLDAFRVARNLFPRGLYGDAEEQSTLTRDIKALLLRADELHSEEGKLDCGEVIASEKQSHLERLREAMERNRRMSPKPVKAAMKSAKQMAGG